MKTETAVGTLFICFNIASMIVGGLLTTILIMG
jgi:hypothetical protein